MRFFGFLLALVILVLAQTHSVAACDLCSIYSATTASGTSGNGLQLGMAEQFTHHGTLKDNGTAIANPLNQSLNSSVTQFFLNYNLNKSWGTQTTLPILYRNFQRANGTVAETGTVFGIGDMTLLGKFMPYEVNHENFSFIPHLMAGIKFPTGSTSRLDEEASETPPAPGDVESGVHGHDLTLGSGSFDGVLGINLFVRWVRLLTTADAQWMIHTKGADHYRIANDLNWNVAPGAYLWLRHDFTVALQDRISGEYKGKDTSGGVAADDTGITTLYMGPQMLFTWQEHWSAQLGADLPIVIENTALQITPDYRIRTAITWRL